MRRRISNNKKGMSIVISTVIIIAITITMAIAVAFWAMGLGNSFTKFEKLEFVSIYADVPVNRGFQGGTQATAIVTALDTNGGISALQVTNGGSGYSSQILPIISFIGGGGSGASATAVVNPTTTSITSITITNAGSGYTSPPTISISPPMRIAYTPCFPVYIQLQNTGQIAATINNVFLDGKPYSAYPYVGQTGGQNLVGTVLNVGVRNNGFSIYLPVSQTAGASGWKSGDYVEVEIETTSGKLYSNTVLLP